MKRDQKSGFGWKSYRNQIVLGLIGMGAFTLFLAIYAQNLSNNLTAQAQHTAQAVNPVAKGSHALDAQVTASQQKMQAYLLTGKEQYYTAWNQIWEQEITRLQQSLEKANTRLEHPQINRLIPRIEAGMKAQKTLQRDIMQQVREQLKPNGIYENVSDPDHQSMIMAQEQAIAENVMPEMESLQGQLKELEQHAQLYAQQQQESYSQEISRIEWIGWSAFILCIIAGFGIGYLIVPRLLQDIKVIKQALQELGKGDIPERLRERPNETNLLVREINRLLINMQHIKAIAQKVGAGEFENDIEVFESQGAIGHSVAEMKKSLKAVAEEDKKRNWTNEGVAQFSELLRANNQDVQQLCDVIISEITKYLGASQGTLFLREESGEEQVMAARSCYAFDRRKRLELKLQLGEGMVGQAWRENDTLNLTDVPDEYVKIRSGLGGSHPRNIVIVPLRTNEEVLGVLELASFKPFEPHQIHFLEVIGENIAASVFTTLNNERTSSLLEESRQMTEEMRAQEEEMRQNMEELEATQEEMHRAQGELQEQQFHLNGLIDNTNDTIFAIDTDYRITVVNKVLKDKYHKMGIELERGTNILEILPEGLREKWQERYDRGLRGEQYTLIEESSGSDGQRFVETFHNPIRNQDHQVIGVSVIARDVTKMYRAQNEALKKQATLNALIDNTDDTYFAIDTDYRIMVANKTLRDRFKGSGIELKEGMNIFECLPEADHAKWKERYSRALGGEHFVLNEERKVREKTLYIEVHHNPIFDEKGEIVGASVMSRDITQYREALENRDKREAEISKLKKALGMEKSSSRSMN